MKKTSKAQIKVKYILQISLKTKFDNTLTWHFGNSGE